MAEQTYTIAPLRWRENKGKSQPRWVAKTALWDVVVQAGGERGADTAAERRARRFQWSVWIAYHQGTGFGATVEQCKADAEKYHREQVSLLLRATGEPVARARQITGRVGTPGE